MSFNDLSKDIVINNLKIQMCSISEQLNALQHSHEFLAEDVQTPNWTDTKNEIDKANRMLKLMGAYSLCRPGEMYRDAVKATVAKWIKVK